MRIVLVVREQALRIASAVVRAHDFSDHVTVLDLSTDNEIRHLSEQSGATVISHSGDTAAPTIASLIVDTISDEERTAIISLDDDWKLSDMARTVGLARQGYDLFIAFKHRSRNRRGSDSNPSIPLSSDTYTYADADIQFACASAAGLRAVAQQAKEDVPADLDDSIDLRVVELDAPSGPPPRESLASASRFAQFFYWMLESKHPLILFGVPGVIFFILGFEMASKLIEFGGPHDSVSLGVALAAFITTFVGVFSLTASMILYVLGKQVDRLPKSSD